MSRTSDKSPKYSAVAAKAKKIEKLLALSFRARWNAIEVDLAKGVNVAKARAPFFLANDSRARLRIARRYYAPARAKQFANASIGEIVKLCWAWFIPFQIYAHNSEGELRELGEQLRPLVAAEYVAMTWGLFDVRGEDWNWDPSEPFSIDELSCYASPEFCPLHSECDAYEIIAVGGSGNYLRICKSVPEPFHKAERIRAMDKIEGQFLSNAAAEGADPRTFRLDFRLPEYSRELIEVDIIDGDSSYQKPIHRELAAQLKATGAGYIKRPPPDLRWFYEPDPRKPRKAVRKSR